MPQRWDGSWILPAAWFWVRARRREGHWVGVSWRVAGHGLARRGGSRCTDDRERKAGVACAIVCNEQTPAASNRRPHRHLQRSRPSMHPVYGTVGTVSFTTLAAHPTCDECSEVNSLGPHPQVLGLATPKRF